MAWSESTQAVWAAFLLRLVTSLTNITVTEELTAALLGHEDINTQNYN